MRDRSIFWPLVLIATGILWILTGTGIVPRENLWALVYVLPYVLIALGLGLILRSFWRGAGMLVSLLIVAGAVFAVFYAPQFGWTEVPAWTNWNIGPDLGGKLSGSGVTQTETRQVSDFQAVTVSYPAEVLIQQGDSETLKITADDNLLPQLSTQVRGGVLYIENSEPNWNNRVRPSHTVQVTITVKDLQRVSLPSAGKISIEGLQTDNLSLSVSGAGDINLTSLDIQNLDCSLSGAGNINADGVTKNVNLNISGFGNFNGNDLKSQSASVSLSGAGNANLRVESQLDVHISGAGSVHYYGNPSVTQNINGVGDVRQVGE